MIFFSHNPLISKKLSYHSVFIGKYFYFFQEKLSVCYKKNIKNKKSPAPHYCETGLVSFKDGLDSN